MATADAQVLVGNVPAGSVTGAGLAQGDVVAPVQHLAVLSDEEVMLELQRDRDEALDELYRRHYRGVYIFLSRMVQDRHMAEDLLQETYIRVYNNRHNWEPRSKFTSWLYRIARNLCIDEKRRYWNRLVQMDSQTVRDNADFGTTTLLERTESGDTDARELASQAVDEDQIRHAINTLSEEQREVMILNKYQGLSYAEIADVLGVTPESVKQRAYRAHMKLRELLAPLLDEYAN